MTSYTGTLRARLRDEERSERTFGLRGVGGGREAVDPRPGRTLSGRQALEEGGRRRAENRGILNPKCECSYLWCGAGLAKFWVKQIL